MPEVEVRDPRTGKLVLTYTSETRTIRVQRRGRLLVAVTVDQLDRAAVKAAVLPKRKP